MSKPPHWAGLLEPLGSSVGEAALLWEKLHFCGISLLWDTTLLANFSGVADPPGVNPTRPLLLRPPLSRTPECSPRIGDGWVVRLP